MFLPFVLALAAEPRVVIRVNQVGYLPDAPKVAVACALDSALRGQSALFSVRDTNGRVIVAERLARPSGSFGPCRETWRFDFSSLRMPGRYVVVTGDAQSPAIRIAPNVYDGAADTTLHYLRQQRSGFNPFFKDSVHRLDGFVVDDTGRVVKFQPVSGGWADAADYLQYVATSATATYQLLMAARDHRRAFHDSVGANGLAGANR